MKRFVLFAVLIAIFLSPMAQCETVIVDDNFDDGAIGTNTNGIGTGFNSEVRSYGSVTEADSLVTLSNATNGASRLTIASKDGAAIGNGITRFEFLGVSLSVSVGGATGGLERQILGVKGDSATPDVDSGYPTGFWIQIENDSLTSGNADQTSNGISTLFYCDGGTDAGSGDDVKTVLAQWECLTLDPSSDAGNFDPVLDFILDIDDTGYSLTVSGDAINVTSGSLSGTFADAGITNQLTTGYAWAFTQTERPSLAISIDQIISIEEASAFGPYNPVVTPDNGDGTVGNIVNLGGVDWQIQDITLAFIAAPDPNELTGYPMNPDVLKHNIYIQTGAPTDPNLYLYDDEVFQAEVTYATDPNIIYGPLPGDLFAQATTYKWQVEEVIIDPNTGSEYPAGDPNNIFGPVWTFTTASATPAVTVNPIHTLTDEYGNATLSIETGAIANEFKWFKVDGVKDTDPLAADDVADIDLTDNAAGIYSGADTKVLTITGASSEGLDDGQFYAVAYNGDSDSADSPSDASSTAWVWYPRMTNHFTFEADKYDSEAKLIKAEKGDADVKLLSDDGTPDVPTLDANVSPISTSVNSLFFNNPNTNDDPNNADGQYAEITDPYFAGYKDITISAWIYFKGGGWQRILSIGNDNGSGTGGNNYMYLTPAGNNNNGSLMLNVNGTSVSSATGSISLNEWAYVTATLSDNTAKLYVNGELVATNTSFGNDPVANAPAPHVWIGRSQWYTYDSLYNGYIDDLKVWNYGRDNVQVAQDYLADDTSVSHVCNVELYDNAAWKAFDYNENCIVDLEDFAVLASNWFLSDRITLDE